MKAESRNNNNATRGTWKYCIGLRSDDQLHFSLHRLTAWPSAMFLLGFLCCISLSQTSSGETQTNRIYALVHGSVGTRTFGAGADWVSWHSYDTRTTWGVTGYEDASLYNRSHRYFAFFDIPNEVRNSRVDSVWFEKETRYTDARLAKMDWLDLYEIKPGYTFNSFWQLAESTRWSYLKDTFLGMARPPLISSDTTSSLYNRQWGGTVPSQIGYCFAADPEIVSGTVGDQSNYIEFKSTRLCIKYTKTGSLQVYIQGGGGSGRWRRVGTTTWRSSGYKEDDIPIPSCHIEFQDVSGWVKPANILAAIGWNQTSIIYDATYVSITRVIRLTGDLAFGNVTVGQSAQRTMRIHNDGNSTLNVSSISYPNRFSGNWSGGSIAAGSYRDVTVTFSPNAASSFGGTITVNSDKTSGTHTHPCSGTGVSTPPPTRIIRITGDLAFGNITVGQSAQRTMRIHNDGNSTLNVSSISYPNRFSGNWSGGSIGAGSYRDVTVTFSPNAASVFGGTITVSSDRTSGNHQHSCSGTGVSTPPPTRIIRITGDLAFGNVMVNQSAQRNMRIYNDGDSTLNVSSISYPNRFSGNWSGGSIGAGSYRDVTVTFSPNAESSFGGTITVNSDKTSGTHTHPCSGTGVTTTGGSLGDAVDAPSLTWTTGGNVNWFRQTTVSRYGGDAAQSGAITHNQQSWMQTTVSGPGTISFWWKVSSEQNYDYLRFYIGSSQQQSISGNVDWQQRSFSVPAGMQTLKWQYEKDGSITSGSDCGWVDQVVWTPGSQATTLRINSGGDNVSGWGKDRGFSGKTVKYQVSRTIKNTGDVPQGVLRCLRGVFAPNVLNYNFADVPSGNYRVRLHFADVYMPGGGKPRFDVRIEGLQVLSKFRVYGAAGGFDRAIVREFQTAVDGNGLQLSFKPRSGGAFINAIEVIPAGESSSLGLSEYFLGLDDIADKCAVNAQAVSSLKSPVCLSDVWTSGNRDEHHTGSNAVDGDLSTAWIGDAGAPSWWLALGYRQLVPVSGVAVILAKESVTNLVFIGSRDGLEWFDLDKVWTNGPAEVEYLWISFTPGEWETNLVPKVLEIEVEQPGIRR